MPALHMMFEIVLNFEIPGTTGDRSEEQGDRDGNVTGLDRAVRAEAGAISRENRSITESHSNRDLDLVMEPRQFRRKAKLIPLFLPAAPRSPAIPSDPRPCIQRPATGPRQIGPNTREKCRCQVILLCGLNRPYSTRRDVAKTQIQRKSEKSVMMLISGPQTPSQRLLCGGDFWRIHLLSANEID